MCQVVISTVKTQIFFFHICSRFVYYYLSGVYVPTIPLHCPWKLCDPQTSAIPNMESFQRLYFFPKTTNLWKFRKILSNFLHCTVLFRNFGGWWTSHLFDRSIRAYSRQAVADFRIEYVSMLFSYLAQRWHGVGVQNVAARLCMCELDGVLSVC